MMMTMTVTKIMITNTLVNKEQKGQKHWFLNIISHMQKVASIHKEVAQTIGICVNPNWWNKSTKSLQANT
jgi:hypothetical protein